MPVGALKRYQIETELVSKNSGSPRWLVAPVRLALTVVPTRSGAARSKSSFGGAAEALGASTASANATTMVERAARDPFQHAGSPRRAMCTP